MHEVLANGGGQGESGVEEKEFGQEPWGLALPEPETRLPRSFRAGMVAVALSIVGSAMWELLLRPAYSGFTSEASSVYHRLWQRVYDSGCASASKDPGGVAAIVLYQSLGAIPSAIFVFMILLALYVTFPERLRRILQPAIGSPPATTRRRHYLKIIGIILLWGAVVDWGYVSYEAFTRGLKLVTAWNYRTAFYQQLNVVSPYLSPIEEKKFMARFYGAWREKDCKDLGNDLHKLALERAMAHATDDLKPAARPAPSESPK